MSADNSSQNAGDKVQDAAERTKEAVKSAVHDAGEALRGGAELFKKDLENVKDAVNEKLHRDAAEAERARRETNLTASERVASVANEIKNNAQADVDELKQAARKQSP